MDTHQVTAPALQDLLPGHAAHLAAEPELVVAWEQEVSERRAQAAKVEALLGYKSRKLEQNQKQHAFTRRAVEKAVVREAAAVLGLSEAAVRRLLGVAEFLSEKLPKTWDIYQAGVIDRERAVKAAHAVEDIAHREDLLEVIDAEIAARAPGENATSLQKWVTRRVQELDTAGFQQRYDRAQGRRYVRFHHVGDGMSRIDALIPTLVAAQVEQQIYAVARNAPRALTGCPSSTGTADSDQAEVTPGASDLQEASPQEMTVQERRLQERTLSQRIADAFIDRLHQPQADAGAIGADAAELGGVSQRKVPGALASDGAGSLSTGSAGPPGVKIGLLVPVQTLTGDSDEPALSWDRSWSLPAGTARQLVLDPDAEHDWYIVGTTASDAAKSARAQCSSASSGVSDPGSIVSSTERPATTQPHPAAYAQVPITEVSPEILTVVHPRKGPSGQSLTEWINGADPQEQNLLSRAYRSRTSRDRQRDAILIRDGQCTHPGCTNPGWQAEIDHTQSYETGGHTIGENLRVLCRDCHAIKSHRLDRNHRLGRSRSAGSAGTRPTHSVESGPPQHGPRQQGGEKQSRASPTGTSPADEDLPEWLVETRPPPDWAVHEVA